MASGKKPDLRRLARSSGAVNSPMERADVRCYSGHTYAQEPISFAWNGQELAVAEVLSRRRVLDAGRSVIKFVVRTEDGGRFRLSYNEAEDAWSVRSLHQK